MSYDVINIDTSAYFTASGNARAAAKKLEDAADKLLAAASAASNSAGHGAGDDFANDYEPQAAAALENVGGLISSLYAVSARFADSGNIHETAELRAAGRSPQAEAATPAPLVIVPDPASIRGGTGAKPVGWQIVEGMVTEVWPDADAGRLSALTSAWHDFGDAVSDARALHVADLMSAFGGYLSPELPTAQSVVSQLGNELNTLAGQAHDIGHSVTGFINRFQSTHKQIEDTLTELLITLGVGSAIGGALTVVTAGLSDFAAGAADVAEIGSAAWRISNILRDLRVLKYFQNAVKAVKTIDELPKAFDNGAARIGTKAAVGLAKGVFQGGVVWGPSAMVAEKVVTGRVNVAETEEVALFGGAGAGLAEGVVSGGFEVWAESGVKAAAKAAGSGVESGAEESSAAAGRSLDADGQRMVEDVQRSAGSARHLAGSQHAETSKFANSREIKLVMGDRAGKLAGAAAGTATSLTIENKLNSTNFLLGSGGDLVRNKIVVIFPEIAGAHAG